MLTRRGSRSRPVYLHQITREHFGVLQLVNYTPIKPKHNKGRWDPETPGFPRVQCEPHSRLSCSSCPLVSTTGTSAALRAEGTRQTRGERRPWASVLCSAPHPPGAPPPARLPPLRVAPSPLQHMCVLQSRHTNSEHWGLSRLRGERRPGFVGGVAAPQQQRAPAQAAQPPPADQHASRSIHPMPAASKENEGPHGHWWQGQLLWLAMGSSRLSSTSHPEKLLRTPAPALSPFPNRRSPGCRCTAPRQGGLFPGHPPHAGLRSPPAATAGDGGDL